MGVFIMDDKFRDLLDIMESHAWIQDLETYYWANKSHAEFMGLNQYQCHNLKKSKVLCEEELKKCLLSSRAVLAERKPIQSKEWVRNKHGEKRLLSITKVPFENEGRIKYILCKAKNVTENTSLKGELGKGHSLMRDIAEIKQVESELHQAQETLEWQVTERTKELNQLNEFLENQTDEKRKAELLLKKRYEFEKVLLRVSSRFIKVIAIDSAITDALNDLGNICQADRSFIFLFKENGAKVDNTHEWCAEGITPQIENHKGLSCDAFPWWVEKIKNNQTILIEDVSKLPAEANKEKELLGRQGVKALIALPLFVTGAVVGFIGLHGVDEISKWTEEDFTTLRLFSEIIGNALERNKSRQELSNTNIKLQKLLDDTVELLASTVGMVDPYTANHQHCVADIACKIARYMGLSENYVNGIKVAALLHDLGKLHVPASILSKPSKLTHNEFNLIKDHTTMGYDILKKADFPWPVADIVLQHHERIDGSGYPAGIEGQEILLEARILAVADVVEAMCSHRPYRAALNKDLAREEIVRNNGIKYDSDVVDACLKVFFLNDRKYI